MVVTPPPSRAKRNPPATIAGVVLPSFIRSARSTRRRHHRSPHPLVQLDRDVIAGVVPVHMPATLNFQPRTARSRKRALCPAGSPPKVPYAIVSSAIPRNYMALAIPRHPSSRAGAMHSRTLIFAAIALSATLAVTIAGTPVPPAAPPAFPPPGDTTAQKPAFAPLSYDCKFTAISPVLDGKLNDSAWSATTWTSDFLDVQGPALLLRAIALV